MRKKGIQSRTPQPPVNGEVDFGGRSRLSDGSQRLSFLSSDTPSVSIAKYRPPQPLQAQAFERVDSPSSWYSRPRGGAPILVPSSTPKESAAQVPTAPFPQQPPRPVSPTPPREKVMYNYPIRFVAAGSVVYDVQKTTWPHSR